MNGTMFAGRFGMSIIDFGSKRHYTITWEFWMSF